MEGYIAYMLDVKCFRTELLDVAGYWLQKQKIHVAMFKLEEAYSHNKYNLPLALLLLGLLTSVAAATCS